MMRLITRSPLVANSIYIHRKATAKDVGILTHRAVAEDWHVGLHDFSCAYEFDPNGFFVGEIDGEVASHIAVIRYPNHSSFLSAIIVDKKFRGKGIATEDTYLCLGVCDKTYTIGGDFGDSLYSLGEKLGFKTAWNSYHAAISLEKIVTSLRKTTFPSSVAVKSIRDVKMEKVLKYDQHVFGTARHKFISKWISAPGNFGWAAVNEKNGDVLGYAVIRQVIRAGLDIGLAMAPLFANNAHIAKYLLKTAAEYCLANEAMPDTKLELFHPVGDNCGEDAPQIMSELEAELTHVDYRMYSKGVPSGRQVKKIYGIASLSFD